MYRTWFQISNHYGIFESQHGNVITAATMIDNLSSQSCCRAHFMGAVNFHDTLKNSEPGQKSKAIYDNEDWEEANDRSCRYCHKEKYLFLNY